MLVLTSQTQATDDTAGVSLGKSGAILALCNVAVNVVSLSVLPETVGTRIMTTSPDGKVLTPNSTGGMISVLMDVLKGARLTHDISGGYHLTRTAFVDGLDPGTVAQMCVQAENAVTAITGPRGTADPDLPVMNYIDAFEPSLVGPRQVEMLIVIKGYPLPTYEIDSSLSQVESNKDINGKTISLQYTYPPRPVERSTAYQWFGPPEMASTTVIQGGMYSRPVPQQCFTVKFLVLGDIGAASIWSQFVGSVNSSQFAIGAIIGLPHTWQVKRVHMLSKDGGADFEGQFTVEYRPDTWDTPVVFIDPTTGKPPPDVVEGVGTAIVRSSPEMRFPTFFGTSVN